MAPFAYKAMLEALDGQSFEGCLIIIASNSSVAIERGQSETIEMLEDSSGERIVHEWLEVVVPYVVCASGSREPPDWAAASSGSFPGVFFCSAEAMSGRQPFARGSYVHSQVNALVRSADFDEAEAVWQAFLEEEYPGMTVSSISEDLPPIVAMESPSDQRAS